MGNKLKVVVRAPSLTMSGYGVHARQICKWALSRDDFDVRFDLLNWGVNSWLINSELKDGLIGEIMSKSNDKWGEDIKPDLSFQVQLPNEWDPQLAHVNVGLTAAVETDICNPEWISNCNQMHAVVVPSNHVKYVLENTSNRTGNELRTPVIVIPESYIESIDSVDKNTVTEYTDIINDKLECIDTEFNFLIMGQITANNAHTDRKNTFNALKLFHETFAGNENVGLILKTNSGHLTKIDKKVTSTLLKQALTQIRGDKKYPKVYLMHGNMNDTEVAELYKHDKVHAFLSLTRGEGFGLPLLEAAASDLPIIATGWSGHMDFLSMGKFLNVNYGLQKIDQARVDNIIFMEGSSWAEVDYQDASTKMKKAISNHNELTELSEDLGKEVRHNFSQAKIIEYYNTFLKDAFGL